ncbi:MAG TPA: hypothetical protein VNM72_09415 [Blastocatellia bacterium]|nr:hypothetical protein [Blastocatellia bacterium]
MNGKGNLILDFVNVYGDRPDDRVDILLKAVGAKVYIRDKRTSAPVRISNLDISQGGIYSVQVFPLRHRPVGRFVRVIEGKGVRQAFILPIDPKHVEKVEFPAYDDLPEDLKRVLENSQVEGYEDARGAILYHALDDIRKAGLLNLYWKMKATRFENGRDVFSYVSSLHRLRGDRFFARVEKELRDQVKNSVHDHLFQEVSGIMHTPPPGSKLIDSFKTQDRYGNLQLTFFNRPETLEFIVDSDIDDAQGIGHIFQVLSHALTGSETHPYDIHQILVEHQKIDPHYRLVV